MPPPALLRGHAERSRPLACPFGYPR
jgi:hypothetical protein